jgi:outer membrane protein assembly factor BamD
MHRFPDSASLLAFVLVAAGCAGTNATLSSSPIQPTTTLSQSRQEYLAGLRALESADYAASMDTLQKVARGPSYIVYAPLARLRLADALFYQEKFDEAVEGYRTFIETASGDPNLHYAYFRLAESRVKAISGDFFLVPPSDRRDQKRVRSALAALRDFTARFPDSPYIVDALLMQDRMTIVVASFEMEVARFYMSRGKPVGAAGRLQRLVADVPSAKRLEDARFALVEALSASKDSTLSTACTAYLEDFPAGKHRSKASRLCSWTIPPQGG